MGGFDGCVEPGLELGVTRPDPRKSSAWEGTCQPALSRAFQFNTF